MNCVPLDSRYSNAVNADASGEGTPAILNKPFLRFRIACFVIQVLGLL